MKNLLRLLTLVVALLIPALSSCVGAPRSLDQLEQMDPVDYEAWAKRVEAWSEAAGYTAAEQGGDVAKIQAFCVYLGAVTDPTATVLSDAADAAGFDQPLVRLLVLEAQQLLAMRGGIPEGERGMQLLARIAASVATGAGKGAAARP